MTINGPIKGVLIGLDAFDAGDWVLSLVVGDYFLNDTIVAGEAFTGGETGVGVD